MRGLTPLGGGWGATASAMAALLGEDDSHHPNNAGAEVDSGLCSPMTSVPSEPVFPAAGLKVT